MTTHPTPELDAGPVRLRPWRDDEADDFVRLLADPAVGRWMGGGAATEEELRGVWLRLFAVVYAEQRWPVWAVDLEGEPVGHAEVKPSPHPAVDGWEVVYALRPSVQRRGLGTAVAGALTAFGHEVVGLDVVHATVDPENAASLRVLDRLGYLRLEDLPDVEEGGVSAHLVHRAGDD